ncbi:MAG TPA: ABC transporter permease subunit, partial [Anaerolineae bacterium]|nr:ABC transporter permease subunit [Anaerolineae bacterium]
MSKNPTVSTVERRAIVPFWRNVRVLRILSQVVFVILVALVAGMLYSNMKQGLESRGLGGGFGFLWLEAGFDIGEGITYDPSDSYARAFLVGVVNTLRVTAVGIVLATILGVVMGVARLSSNWLVNKIASVYIESIRNTPLLVQLFVWYFAVILKLPRVKESIVLPGSIFVSNRGVALPWPVPSDSFGSWSPYLMGALAGAVALWIVRARGGRRMGRPPFSSLWVGIAFVGIAALGWFLAPSSPLVLDVPALRGLNYQGGLTLTPEFTALLVGLVVYTGAFIAEVVRAGIQAVPRGQIEAARAVGLNEMQTLRLVIFPQALRIIVPPLTSQYLNLAKNSSLAIAIGFPDLFNEWGQQLQHVQGDGSRV